MATPTLINLPEPPSNPETPTEAPGTPNSTTTSLSALSTTAIKDGHRGASFPHTYGHRNTPSSNTLEAERADRISRLAGLERVSTVRPSQTPGGGTPGGQNAGPAGQIPGYFDQNGNPVYTTKMSTVGSASATGSASGGGQTTTWASGSMKGGQTETEGDDDEMSMDTNERDIDERDRYSASAMDEEDGMSDSTSLVGFGEGAGSTVSGPIYTRKEGLGKLALAAQLQREGGGNATPLSDRTTATAEEQRRDARMLDGLAVDTGDYVDTAARGGGVRVGDGANTPRSSGVETAERILRNRIEDSDGMKPALGTPEEAGLGKFYFEEKK